MGWKKKARYGLFSVACGAAWLKAEGIWAIGSPFWGHLAVACALSVCLLWVWELKDKKKAASVSGAVIPETYTWIGGSVLDNVIEGSLPILRIKARHEAASRGLRQPYFGRGLSNEEKLMLQEITDAKIYLYEKILADYPQAKKGNKYSKENFEWALRKIAMEKGDE